MATWQMVCIMAAEAIFAALFTILAAWILIGTVDEFRVTWKEPHAQTWALVKASVMCLFLFCLALTIYSFMMDFLRLLQIYSSIWG